MYRIREEAINTALARVLREKHGLTTYAEVIEDRRRPDVIIKPVKSSKVHICLEAKIGQGKEQKRQAFQQALSHLKSGKNDVFASIALCYPEDMRLVSDEKQIENKLWNTNELHFAGITNSGQTYSFWDQAGIEGLYSLATDIESGDLIYLGKFEKAVERIAKNLEASDELDKNLANALKITAPKSQRIDNQQVIKIASLIWLNAAMMQIKIHSSLTAARRKDFPDIGEAKKETHPGNALLRQWLSILEIDYRYIFFPAREALEAVPTQDRAVLAKAFISEAEELAPVMGNIKLDYAGPLYHQLLATAQNDGSFYTTTEAAKILVELALPNKHPKWNQDNINSLRVIDPACGTGTLLVSSLSKIKEGAIAAGIQLNDGKLHKMLVENCLYGCDINRHAVHLAACMLAIPNPSVDYSKMNLFRFRHGKYEGRAYAGSLEMLGLQGLADDLFPSEQVFKAIESDGRNARKESSNEFDKKFDIVVMNPPYTRNSLRNQQHSVAHHKAIDARERKIQDELRSKDVKAAESIRNTSIQTYFPALADYLLNKSDGIMASVIPTTVASGTDALPQRIFMANRFHIDTVVTSHDPCRKFFSGNTGINESLLIARRSKQREARFINLRRNPKTILEARAMVSDIRKGNFAPWGTVTKWSREKMIAGDWKPALYYNPELLGLVEEVEGLEAGGKLKALKEMAVLNPAGRIIADVCTQERLSKAVPYIGLWNNRASKNDKVMVEPDCSLVCKPNKRPERLEELWAYRSHLLLPHRVRMTNLKTFAAWSSKQVLGQAWVPVNYSGGGGRT